MATNLIAQNFKLSSDKSQIVSDAVLLSLETGTKVLDGTGKEFIKVESNIFDLVDRDFITHDEFPIDRIAQIAFKDEENTFIKTNTFRDIIPSTSNTYSVGSDSKKWGNLYSTKVTINGITVEKLSSSSENTSLYLPKVTGDYVHTIAQGNKDGLGSSIKAIYLASNGELKECTNSIDVFKASGTNAKEGIVPKPSTTAGTSKFLREDATWSDLPVATASALGVVKVGNYINVSSGKISVDQASTTDYGVVKVGHALKIGSNGTLDVDENLLNITYNAGTGLELSGTTFSLTQEVLNQLNRTYKAGTGLELSGTTFSIDEDYIKNLSVATKYKSQQGMILLSGKIKIQYFMATPNARIAYPYGGYTSNPLALVSRCHLGYNSSSPYDYASDYIGTVNTGKTDCYLAWTQDNADSKYPIIVFGITDGTTTADSSSSSEDDPTYISGTWYYIGSDNPNTSSISASNIWSSYVNYGGYSGAQYTGSGSHPSSGTYKGTWSRLGFGSNSLYKTTSLYKIA